MASCGESLSGIVEVQASASVRLSFGEQSDPDYSGMINRGLPQRQRYTEIGRKQVMARTYQGGDGNFDKRNAGKRNHGRKKRGLRNPRNREVDPRKPVSAVAFLGMCIETAR